MTVSERTRADPPDAAALLAQISAKAMSDRPEAVRLALQAKADGLRSPLVHYFAALELKETGRYEDAIAELGLGLELAPNEAGLMTEVGFCLVLLDRAAEAAKVFEAAIRADPAWAPAYFGYGQAAEQLGALDQARAAWEQTLKLNPQHTEALAGLAGLAARRGDWLAAREFAGRALAIEPGQTDATATLTRVELGEGAYDAAIGRVSHLLTNLTGVSHADACLLLGDCLDAAGRYVDAFTAYADGKSELRALYAPAFAKPDQISATAAVKDIAAEFEMTSGDSWRRRSVDSGAPVRLHAFLLGFPRSGTTLLEQIISTHPDMVALGERPALTEAIRDFLSGTGGIERLAATVSELLEPYRESYWSRARQFVPDLDGKVFVDKYPLATLRLPLMCKLFPSSRVIFALRDPRDVVLSCFRRSFKMNPSMYEFTSLETAALLYDAVMAAGETYLARLPLNVHRLRYEDLVANFEREARALCEFLGVEWTPDLQNFAASDRILATPSGPQVARGLYSEGAGQWRNYAEQIEPVLPILQPWIEKLGYQL